ncbi:transposase [Kitasatospora sp. NPDC004240]
MGAHRAVVAGPDAEAGGRWRDHWQVIDAIAWKFQTGSQWVHLPAEYGSWKGAYTRLRNWVIDGTWEKVFTVLLAQADAEATCRGCRQRRYLGWQGTLIADAPETIRRKCLRAGPRCGLRQTRGR